MILLLFAACAPGTRSTEVQVAVSLGDGAVIDPKLDGFAGVALDVHLSGSAADCAPVAAHFENVHGQRRGWDPAETGRWDGRDDEGRLFAAGAYAAVVEAACTDGASASGSATGHVVRAGLAAVDFVDDGTGSQVDLAFHRLDLVTRGVTPITMPEYAPHADPAPLDDATGAPRPPPGPWPDAGAPPWGRDPVDSVDHNLPVAYRAGAAMAVVVTLAETTIGEDGTTRPAASVPLRAAPVGWTRRDDDSFVSPPLDPTLGVGEVVVTWRFEAEQSGVWTPIQGSTVTSHRVYRTLGPARLRDGTSLGFAANLAWVGALAELAPVLEGAEPDPEVVLDAIRAHLYTNRWVLYDPSDRDYSGYAGEYIYWDYAWSELSDWLDRASGVRLYCHSMSCLMSVLANHEGVYAAQEVIGVGFDTHLTRAAGSEAWVRWSFNSHSVVSPDGGTTLWDAAVDLDGDEDPSAEPVTPVSPAGLPRAEYLALLTDDPVDIVNEGQCYFR